MKRNDIFTLVIVAVILLLSLVPLAGLLRAMPIPGESGARPLGSLFPGTPLYTTDVLNGDNIDYSVWAAERYLAGENVYDLKPRFRDNDTFLYPPMLLFIGLFILVFKPFHFYLWFLVLAAAVAAIAIIANKLLKEKGVERNTRWIAVALIILAQGMIRNIGYGHYYVLVVGLLFMLYWFLRKNEIAAGIIYGLLNSILLYGFIFIPYLAIKRKWKAIALGIVIPIIPVIVLALTNTASFEGFLPFLAKGGTYGLSIQEGNFSITRFLGASPLLYVYIALQGLAFLYFTWLLWKKKGVSDEAYLAFCVLFLLVTEPWFSGHHTITAIFAYVLLFSEFVLLPYFLTEANYQTLIGVGLAGGYLLNSYFLFIGCAIMYAYCVIIMLRQSKVRWKA
jgi:hypothetical protein